jgi:hypothetical protein
MKSSRENSNLASGANAFALKGPKASYISIFIRAGKPRIADDVGHQDLAQFPGLAHCASPVSGKIAQSPPEVARCLMSNQTGGVDLACLD